MLAQKERIKDIYILECQGALNAAAMVTLNNKVRRLMDQDRKKVVLDLAQTRHVDLAALGILVERIKEVRSVQGDIKLCNVSRKVKSTFKMVGVTKLIETFSTKQAALRSFQVA